VTCLARPAFGVLREWRREVEGAGPTSYVATRNGGVGIRPRLTNKPPICVCGQGTGQKVLV
jgi:hypothetical protein